MTHASSATAISRTALSQASRPAPRLGSLSRCCEPSHPRCGGLCASSLPVGAACRHNQQRQQPSSYLPARVRRAEKRLPHMWLTSRTRYARTRRCCRRQHASPGVSNAPSRHGKVGVAASDVSLFDSWHLLLLRVHGWRQRWHTSARHSSTSFQGDHELEQAYSICISCQPLLTSMMYHCKFPTYIFHTELRLEASAFYRAPCVRSTPAHPPSSAHSPNPEVHVCLDVERLSKKHVDFSGPGLTPPSAPPRTPTHPCCSCRPGQLQCRSSSACSSWS